MKLIFVSFLLFCSSVSADDFVENASALTKDLKQSLMENLSLKIQNEGPVKAIDFCHENVGKIAKGTAGERLNKYEFGRTSHKVRNPKNAPQEWIAPYLKEFQGKLKNETKKGYIVHQFENKKKAFLRPIYTETQCLICHGEQLSSEVKNKLREIYPSDNATGFKLGEFRGFIWVKEK